MSADPTTPADANRASLRDGSQKAREAAERAGVKLHPRITQTTDLERRVAELERVIAQPVPANPETTRPDGWACPKCGIRIEDDAPVVCPSCGRAAGEVGR